jgi:hypothetical protein
MIRRQAGSDFILITQHDHAILSGQLAERIGNPRFAKPEPYASTILGTQMHDCGWPLHDDLPTLNANGLPIDVFESTLAIAMKVWPASAERAAAADPYAGLLVSLHVMALSVFLFQPPAPFGSEPQGRRPPRDTRPPNQLAKFEINKFQHKEIELQENLRKRLGLRTDLPLKYGLSENPIDVREQRLRANFRLLQAMDRMSLALCCTHPPFGQTGDLYPTPDAAPTHLKLARAGGGPLIVDPWPFDRDAMDFQVPCRRVPGRKYADDAEFQRIYTESPIQNMDVHLRRTA